MPLDLTSRHTFVGASETAAILGLSPFESADEVFWRKVEPESYKKEENEAMATGSRLEPALVKYAAERLGAIVKANDHTTVSGHLGATPDGLVMSRPKRGVIVAGVDGKVTSWSDGWGEEMTDEVPDHYFVQMQQQMEVCDLPVIWMPVLIIGRRAEWRLYRIERDRKIGSDIRGVVENWWTKHVVAGVPPEGSVPPMQVLSRRNRISKECGYDDDGQQLADAYDRVSRSISDAETAKEEIKRCLIDRLGDCDCGLLPDGRRLTYLFTKPKRAVDLDALQAKFPEAYAATLIKAEPSRRFYLPKPKTKLPAPEPVLVPVQPLQLEDASR